MQKRTSKNTCVNSLPAVAKLAAKQGAWVAGAYNLDLGCGKYRQLNRFLGERGVVCTGFDKYRPESTNPTWEARTYATATCSNVLNVIDCPEARRELIATAHARLVDGGALYVTVYEGDGSGEGRESKPDCWQENRKTADYVEEIAEVFGAANVTRKGKLIIAKK